MRPRNGVVAEREEAREVVAVRNDVGLNLRTDLKGLRLEALDHEAEIRCGERRVRVGEVLRREKISDVDSVEQRLHRTVADTAKKTNVRWECVLTMELQEKLLDL